MKYSNWKKSFLNKTICGDSLKIMKQLPDNSIDLIVTAPPYNFSTSVGCNYTQAEYIKWQRKCLKEMFRLIKPTGAIFYIQAFGLQKNLLDDRNAIIKGFPIRQIIAWQEINGSPFTPSPYFDRNYEIIYMIAKEKFKLLSHAKAYGDFWQFAQEENAHPTPFPLELIERIISCTSARIILDPFAGTGNTMVAAKKLGRQYIGIELLEKFADIATKRLENLEVV